MSDWKLDDFQPINLDDTQPSKIERPDEPMRPIARQRKNKRRKNRLRLRLILAFGLIFGLYFFFPWRSNILVLGLDRVPEGTALGRSDTMLIVGIQPFSAEVNLLSLPRDLWVSLPGYGENRINTAHYLAEADEAGSGPQAAIDTVRANFGVRAAYFVRIKLEGFAAVIDALGGLEITLTETAAGLPPGTHLLDGTQALAFVRDRQGDDFFRMENGQLFIRALGKMLLKPGTWLRLPGTFGALSQAVDNNIPIWQWPRLGLALLRAGPDGIDARSLDRTMVNGWTTAAGAQVLLPNWEAINPLIDELF